MKASSVSVLQTTCRLFLLHPETHNTFLLGMKLGGGGAWAEIYQNSKRMCSETETEELQNRRLSQFLLTNYRLQQGGLNERKSGNVSFVSYTIS